MGKLAALVKSTGKMKRTSVGSVAGNEGDDLPAATSMLGGKHWKAAAMTSKLAG
eukprot:CAMPEP_0182897088 /NCGR_PEP_ID=MMETSP0034_2-20130328/26681_1 /TAXON_ID=156128 /ORGANISM="Nephroselmis pyriformis, Strain CCMP717" /LENGTH=53 /DNA_ID=CAMNT_0025030983 /DNA_START=118 /DNA_END=276 /DNA_ORIENTATION=-